MPTGYTAKLMDKRQTFNEFVMDCARAFGACITMRDDPGDTPIPDEFKPDKYYSDALRDAEDDLARLSAMSSGEMREYGAKLIADELKSSREYVKRCDAENARLLEMRRQVEAWTPPTADHVEMKKFMLQQIDVSTNKSKYTLERITELESSDPMKFFLSARISARESVDGRRKSLAEEVERSQNQTKWVRDLRGSLK